MDAGYDVEGMDDGWAVYKQNPDYEDDEAPEWELIAIVDTESLAETLITACGGIRVEWPSTQDATND